MNMRELIEQVEALTGERCSIEIWNDFIYHTVRIDCGKWHSQYQIIQSQVMSIRERDGYGLILKRLFEAFKETYEQFEKDVCVTKE